MSPRFIKHRVNAWRIRTGEGRIKCKGCAEEYGPDSYRIHAYRPLTDPSSGLTSAHIYWRCESWLDDAKWCLAWNLADISPLQMDRAIVTQAAPTIRLPTGEPTALAAVSKPWPPETTEEESIASIKHTLDQGDPFDG